METNLLKTYSKMLNEYQFHIVCCVKLVFKHVGLL